MDVCPSTSLQLRSFAIPIYWQSDFRVQRRQDHQLRGVYLLPIEEFLEHLLHDGNSCGTADKSNIMNIGLAIPLSRRHSSTRLVESPHIQLLKLCCRQQEKSMPSKRESIFLVACVKRRLGAFGPFRLCKQTRPGQTRSRSHSRRCRKLLQTETGNVAQAGSHRERTSQADCYPQSSLYVPSMRSDLREQAVHTLGARTTTVSVVQSLVVHHHRHVRTRHCKRIAAVAAAAVGVAAFAEWKTTCSVLLSFLPVVPCSHFFLIPVSPSASSAKLWVSPTPSLSRACSAALLADRQIRRRPRAVRMCWSAVHTDPPCVSPPRHVSVRHITFFVH